LLNESDFSFLLYCSSVDAEPLAGDSDRIGSDVGILCIEQRAQLRRRKSGTRNKTEKRVLESRSVFHYVGKRFRADRPKPTMAKDGR
jgi:hypothetical protein